FDPPLLDRLGISPGSLHLNPYRQPIGGQCNVKIRQPLLLEGAAMNLHDLGAGPPLFQEADSFLGNARLELLSSAHLLPTPLLSAAAFLARFLFFLLFLLIFLFVFFVVFVFFFLVLLILFLIVFIFFVVFVVFFVFVLFLDLLFVVFRLLFFLVILIFLIVQLIQLVLGEDVGNLGALLALVGVRLSRYTHP